MGIGLVIGLLVGAALGALVVALCVATAEPLPPEEGPCESCDALPPWYPFPSCKCHE